MTHYSMFVAGLLAILLSACGPLAAPTIDPAQVQASAVAAAGTFIAMTQAAIPTATTTPTPSQTPLPSPTLIALPTLGLLAATATQAGNDQCVQTLDVGAAGPTHRTLIRNETTGTISLSLRLYSRNAFGQCGYLSYGKIGKNGTVMADLPAGNWFAYAWATVKGKSFTTSGSFFVQPAQFDKLELCVREKNIVYKPQC